MASYGPPVSHEINLWFMANIFSKGRGGPGRVGEERGGNSLEKEISECRPHKDHIILFSEMIAVRVCVYVCVACTC